MYRIPAVFYLGAKLDSTADNGMKAHAWLNVGKYTIIGGQIAEDGYQVTATFIRPSELLIAK